MRSRVSPFGLRALAASLFSLCLIAVGASPSLAKPPSPSSIVVGVDHVDPANQDFQHGRLFEYTDFFARSVAVHQGETIDFRTAPGAFHIVALAADEGAARAAYPIAYPDEEQAANGGPKLGLGPSNFPIQGGSTSGGGTIAFDRPSGPPVCGRPDLSEPNCTFSGGNQVEVAGPNLNFDQQGNPLPADWNVTINATPGVYHFFCYIHPGMRGTLTVVPSSRPVSNQHQITGRSEGQFQQDRAAALDAEQAANVVSYTGGAPGTRTYLVKMGIAAADNHVAIDEVFPNPATVPGGPPHLTKGDSVTITWPDPHNVHSAFFPAQPPDFSNDIGPFGFDCGSSYQPAETGGPPCTEGAEGVESIADPGNVASGTALTSPTDTFDSGVLVGTGYGVPGSVQQWTLTTNSSTASGGYLFHCTVHDFMVGSFGVSG
ncbi:MAG: cupredoxin domain-containing protein [Actinomycetota bacterium]